MGDEGWFWDRLPKGGCGAPLDYNSSPEKYLKNFKLDEIKLMSPKRGFGSSLRELRNGESIVDRTIKAQKELVYQHELQSQIKEKERLKFSEEKKNDETKLRELDEYLTTYYKSRDDVPSHMKKYMRKKERHLRRKYESLNNKDDDDYDDLDRKFDIQTPPIIGSKRSLFRDNRQYDEDSDSDNHSNYSSKSNRSYRGSNTRRNDDDRDNNNSRRNDYRRSPNEYKQRDSNSFNRRSREGYHARNRDDDGDYDDVPSSRWSENPSPSKTSSSRSKHESKGASNRKGYVTQEEYDKLSDLCENLMQEQDKLLAEVRRQLESIKELKLKIEYNKSTKGSKAIPKNNRIRDHLPKIDKRSLAPVVVKHSGAARYGRKLRPSELPNESALYNANPYEDDLGANGLGKALRRAKGAKSSW